MFYNSFFKVTILSLAFILPALSHAQEEKRVEVEELIQDQQNEEPQANTNKNTSQSTHDDQSKNAPVTLSGHVAPIFKMAAAREKLMALVLDAAAGIEGHLKNGNHLRTTGEVHALKGFVAGDVSDISYADATAEILLKNNDSKDTYTQIGANYNHDQFLGIKHRVSAIASLLIRTDVEGSVGSISGEQSIGGELGAQETNFAESVPYLQAFVKAQGSLCAKVSENEKNRLCLDGSGKLSAGFLQAGLQGTLQPNYTYQINTDRKKLDVINSISIGAQASASGAVGLKQHGIYGEFSPLVISIK